jgi:pimeloyl-ACP methyl ester carboxylesterase
MTPKRRIVTVDGHDRAVYVAGAGSPVVVLEPAIADVGLTWGMVLPGVGRVTTAFTHDRPGLGDSEPMPGPRTVAEMVDEMRATLAAAGAEPPYVLAGHSFASLTVQAFARRYPSEVAALVLVDGAHEDQMERFPPELNPAPMLAAFVSQLADLAEVVERGDHVPPLLEPPASFPAALTEAYAAAAAPTAERLRTAAAEYEGLTESQAQLRGLAGPPLAIPIIALRHGVPQPLPGLPDDVNARYEATWQDLQAELANRSTRGSVRPIEGAGHAIHHDSPDAVVAAIEDSVTAVARSSP